MLKLKMTQASWKRFEYCSLGYSLGTHCLTDCLRKQRNKNEIRGPQLNPETRNFNFLKDECSQVLELKLLRATRLLQGLLVSRSRRDMLKCASMPLCPKFGTEAAPSASSSSRKKHHRCHASCLESLEPGFWVPTGVKALRNELLKHIYSNTIL